MSIGGKSFFGFAVICLRSKFASQWGFGEQAMKIFAAALAMLVLIALPAHAQMQGKRPHGGDTKAEAKKPQVDEKAYKDALERIPEPKEKYDPWGVARPADTAKKPK
jgi:hypothetical protein